MHILPDDKRYGEALRDAALSLLRTHRAALVRGLTRAAVRLALERDEITDDVRGVVPILPGIRPVVVGAAMRDAGIIRRVGYRPSARAVAHARPLSIWRLADAAGATAWLVANTLPSQGGRD